MHLNSSLRCPICNSDRFIIKHQATYTYSYKIGNDIPNNLSFEFDNRENGDSFQYIECENCKTKFPCDVDLSIDQLDFTILQKAIRSDYTDKPELLD